jgi:hypothetical protein
MDRLAASGVFVENDPQETWAALFCCDAKRSFRSAMC